MSSTDVTDVEESQQETEPQPQPSTFAEPDVTVPLTPAVAPVPATKAPARKKAKRPLDSTDTALESLAQYFGKKVPESKQKMSTDDDDHIFGTFLAAEMKKSKKSKSQKLKHELKHKITGALFETQAIDEQEQEREQQQQQMLQSLFVDEQRNTQPLLQLFPMPATE